MKRVTFDIKGRFTHVNILNFVLGCYVTILDNPKKSFDLPAKQF